MTRWLALVAGLAIGLLVLLPARLLLPSPPLSAASADGGLWHARLADARLGGARLGDVDLSLDAAAILRGRLGWRLSGGLEGRLWRSFSGSGGEGLSGRMTDGAIAGLPVAGIQLSGVTIAVDGRGRCQSASGQVTVQLATALAGQKAVSGAPLCENGAVALPLGSSDGRVRLDFSADTSGWHSRLSLSGAGLAEAAALTAAGFRREGTALVQSGEGPW